MKTHLFVLLASLLGVVATAAATAPAPVKWHPGHYIYIDRQELTPAMLVLPHFRGVQKNFSWRTLEPAEGRYDFSSLRADLALAKKYNRQLVMQLTYKSFVRDVRSVPDYLQGPAYGGGVYRATMGSFNPVTWNPQVAARFDALIAALGREFDSHPNLEAVNLPETAPSAHLDVSPQPGVDPYTEQLYFEALKRQMTTLRHAFPHTAVIQYTNFPPKLLVALTDYEKEIGVGMGGPDVYPRGDAVNDPKNGVYRLYAKLAGTVPLGAAVQRSNYSVAAKKRAALGHGHKLATPIVINPGDEKLIPVREHLQVAQAQLKLNYLFWSHDPAEAFANVRKMLAEPDLANDPAGGLEAQLPTKTFLP